MQVHAPPRPSCRSHALPPDILTFFPKQPVIFPVLSCRCFSAPASPYNVSHHTAEEFYSFDAKYNIPESKTIIPADISKEQIEQIQNLAIKAEEETVSLNALLTNVLASYVGFGTQFKQTTANWQTLENKTLAVKTTAKVHNLRDYQNPAVVNG